MDTLCKVMNPKTKKKSLVGIQGIRRGCCFRNTLHEFVKLHVHKLSKSYKVPGRQSSHVSIFMLPMGQPMIMIPIVSVTRRGETAFIEIDAISPAE
jgi:hypothetical protein